MRLTLCALLACASIVAAQEFERPVRMKAGGALIKMGSKGYAAPCWADADGDGKPDLVVGEYDRGRIWVFPHLGAGKFGEGKLLRAGGKALEVPGVW